jgi:ubiquitin C-terminal hydrolase
MWSENCIVSPGGFVASMKQIARLKNQELFTQNSQNDVQEFLVFMLDSFHMALSREVNMTITGNVNNDKDIIGRKCYEMMRQMYTKNYSEMLNLFYGIQMSVITELETGAVLSISPEPFSIISLSIPLVEIPGTGYKRDSYIYDLYAVCNHHGSCSGSGHYTATICTASNQWYTFNDENVKQTEMKGESISSNIPYCLFYRKRHNQMSG